MFQHKPEITCHVTSIKVSLLYPEKKNLKNRDDKKQVS